MALCQQLAHALLAYYDKHARSLPWRGENDLYRIWISEIMLQQTGVSAVEKYYPKFLSHFPDVQTLAQAPLQSLLLHWQGLGYYQRAHHLHRAAHYIIQEWQGILPEERELWLKVPGVGPSTASAILAIGRNQPHAILDGNVKRVLARFLALQESIDGRSGQKILWQAAARLTSKIRPGDYAQAIMDLGATVCTRTQPRCDQCPWQMACVACNAGNPSAYPLRNTKKAKPNKCEVALLFYNSEDKFYFEQRSEKGLLASLWQPCSLPWSADRARPDAATIRSLVQESFAGHVEGAVELLTPVEHLFTHFKLTVYPYRFRVHRLFERAPYCWLPQVEWAQLPMATLHQKVMHSSLITKPLPG
ncbi:MAG: A/G-specific adenine glycosylase [Magnetococcales bacterium]|nr:A/G-specific adenine glycosylase [Magnetococcales bacterium]